MYDLDDLILDKVSFSGRLSVTVYDNNLTSISG